MSVFQTTFAAANRIYFLGHDFKPGQVVGFRIPNRQRQNFSKKPSLFLRPCLIYKVEQDGDYPVLSMAPVIPFAARINGTARRYFYITDTDACSSMGLRHPLAVDMHERKALPAMPKFFQEKYEDTWGYSPRSGLSQPESSLVISLKGTEHTVDFFGVMPPEKLREFRRAFPDAIENTFTYGKRPDSPPTMFPVTARPKAEQEPRARRPIYSLLAS